MARTDTARAGSSRAAATASASHAVLLAELVPSPGALDGTADVDNNNNDNDDNTVYLSPALWDRIAPPHKQARHRALANGGSANAELRIAVSISQLSSTSASRRVQPRQHLPSIIAWARPRAAATAVASDAQADARLVITYPASLAQHLGPPRQGASTQAAFRAAIEPFFPSLPLSAVYLAALDQASFDSAHDQDGSVLHAKLAGRIVRQGEVLSFSTLAPASSSRARYRVIMTEPILQGVVQAPSDGPSSSQAGSPNGASTSTPSSPSSQAETEVVVLLQPDLAATSNDGDSSFSSAMSTSSDDGSSTLDDVHDGINGHAISAGDADQDEDFDISIDEGFLGHSVLQGYTLPSAPASDPVESDSQPAYSRHIPLSRKHLFDPALLDSQAPVEEAISSWRSARLSTLGDGESSGDVHDPQNVDEAVDDHSVVLLPERHLAQLGCFNGDWAIVELVSERIARLVRLYAHPSPPAVGFGHSQNRDQRRKLFMSPLLHQNLHRPANFDPTRSASKAHILPLDTRRQAALAGAPRRAADGSTKASPLLSCPLPVPFAESLTISRLASPLAIDKAYQPLFLEALRTYFQSSSPTDSSDNEPEGNRLKRRIVKEGQIIAVGIQAGKVRFARDAQVNAVVAGGGEEANADELRSKQEGNGGARVDGASAETETDEDGFDDPGFSGPPTGIIYFRIAALAPEATEPEPLPSGPGMSSGSSSANGSASHSLDSGGNWDFETQVLLRDRARRGEYGCVVDPEYTKMVQTGLEHGRVADLGAWLGIASESPACPQQGALPPSEGEVDEAAFPVTALTATDSSPYDKLLHLVQATLMPRAQDLGLHLSVLLKGARGNGKKTVVRWVAQRCGVHLLELNCFDLLSDTDARTEGILRARFEKAASCGPAILLLQNIEALARKSQALESGQEPLMAGVLADCIKSLRRADERRRRKKLAARARAQQAEVSEGKDGHTNGQAANGSAEDLDETDEDDADDADTPLPVAVIATTSDPDKCPTSVLGCFKHEVGISAPNEAERLEILQTAVRGISLYPDVSLKSLATQTAALVAADLVDLVGRAKLAAMTRLQKHFGDHAWSVANAAAAGIALSGADFDVALNQARASYSESIGAPKIPNVTWDDVGGLASVKNDILDTIQLPLEHPELFSDGLKKRSGILLYGPPGTGKTLLAKAVATSCSLNFFSVKGPELLNMYIGESEANVRRVFQKARDAKPCVIFFDELDSVAPKRGNQGDSGGVMDRIVSQLLAELDGMAGGKEGTDVFVIGATNRPDLLDPALLRPGRFDRMLYLSVSETHEAQLNILQALTRKFKLDPDVGNLSVIAEQCPFNLTGADFYALCSDAMLKAMTRKAGEVDEKLEKLNATHPLKPKNASVGANGQLQHTESYPHPYPITPQYYLAEMATPPEIEVRVSRADFEAALRELVPSVSEQEMEHYRAVQSNFSAPDKQGRPQKPDAGQDAASGDPATVRRKAGLEDGPALPLGVGDGVLMPPQEAEASLPSSSSKGKGKQRA